MAPRDTVKPSWFFEFGEAETAPWWGLAACQDHPNAEWWFPKGVGAEAQADIERARSVCRRCPVALSCLKYAMQHPDLEGVWGGSTRAQRRATLRGNPPSSPDMCSKGLHPASETVERVVTTANGRTHANGRRCLSCDREYRASKRKGEAA